jgi:hypothetical protein
MKTPKKPAAAAPNPFDPEKLRLPQDFGATLGVQKALLTVPVRKPAKEWWIRVHPDESYRIQTAMIELKEDREIYLVDPALWPELATESTFGPRLLATTVNKQGVLFLWMIRLPGSDGKLDPWNESALEAVKMATDGWIRVAPNMSLGAYEIFTCLDDKPPVWPKVEFADLLKTAFKGKYIDTMNHPVLRRLRGEV